MNTIRAGLYARVSTDDQSPDMQIDALRKYCDQRGWSIAAEISEVASGSIKDRPERAKLIKMAKQRGLDAIIVWKLDRWGRSSSDVIATIEELKAVGVTFISLTEAIDLATPLGQMFLAVCAAFAQLERDLIQERIKEGVRRYREINGIWGRPPVARAKADKVKELWGIGWSKNKIANTLEISRSSVIRILNKV